MEQALAEPYRAVAYADQSYPALPLSDGEARTVADLRQVTMLLRHAVSEYHPKREFLTWTGLLLLVLGACRPGGAEARRDDRSERGATVSVSAAASGVRIVNDGAEPLAFAIFERGLSQRVRFAPCVDPGPACVRLPAGQAVVVPFDQVGGYTAGARGVVVYTWRVVPDGAAGYRAADLASRTVSL
jgi:hypothetical protein